MTTGDRSTVDQTLEVLRDRILRGEYPAGMALTGERELSAELGVSRLTLRSALARLAAEGLVQSIHGSGNIVRSVREHGGIDLLAHLARLELHGRSPSIKVLRDLLEMRRTIAVETVALVTERASEDDLKRLRREVVALSGKALEAREFMLADLAFARSMVRCTGNIAFELLFNTVEKALLSYPGVEHAFFSNALGTVAVYGAILGRLEARDVTRARNTTSRLLDHLDRMTLSALEPALGV